MRYLLFAGAVLMAVAGCSGHMTSAPATTGSGGGSTASGGAAQVADPCAGGPAGCVALGTVDVDGDGALDAVGVTVGQQPPPDPNLAYGPATITVRVATASGVHEIRVDNPDGNLPSGSPADVLTGAYPISRPVGADLVLHTAAGHGDSDKFVVIGWGGGDLVRVPRPPQSAANFPDPNIWYMQESHGTQEWVTCPGNGSITLVTKSAPSAEGIPLPGGGIRQSDKWSFAAGQWTPAGSENIADNEFSYDFDASVDTFKCDDQRK
jgi:hypothetical protein